MPLRWYRNVLEAGLSCINAVLHPVPALLNTGWIESTAGDFHFYRQGMSASVVRVMQAIDQERMRIASRYGSLRALRGGDDECLLRRAIRQPARLRARERGAQPGEDGPVQHATPLHRAGRAAGAGAVARARPESRHRCAHDARHYPDRLHRAPPATAGRGQCAAAAWTGRARPAGHPCRRSRGLSAGACRVPGNVSAGCAPG
ncbi:hypothetical protein GO497_15640 [Acidovorax citrulli]|nr:hypothetical protein [Paracidovorax citrulli]